MNKKMKGLLLGIIIVIIVGMGGKIYMDQQVEKERAEYVKAVKETQEAVSTYIVENYSGVETIEWNGWSTNNFDSFYTGPRGVDTSMTINGYEDEINGKVQLSYDAFNLSVIEKITDGEDGYIYALPRNYNIKHSEKGSPNAKVIYNLKENK